jgi:prophage regulatory protein
MNVSSNINERLIRIKEVAYQTQLSRSYLYKLAADGQFPKSVSLVDGGASVAWVASEVQNWIDQRIAERDGGAFNG